MSVKKSKKIQPLGIFLDYTYIRVKNKNNFKLQD